VEKLRKAILEAEKYVHQRIEEFEKLGEKGETLFNFEPFLNLTLKADTFSELCFCLLTANSSAITGIKIQAYVGSEGFSSMDINSLTDIFSSLGHRFAHQRAERIVKAREKWEKIEKLLKSVTDSYKLREFLCNPESEFKIKGLGYKEASHFLRNTGCKDIAIVDRHIYRFLVEEGLYPPVKSLTPRRYKEIEKVLGEICARLELTQAELDLYIFYIKTGKVLK